MLQRGTRVGTRALASHTTPITSDALLFTQHGLGGRSSDSGIVATVFGATGFLGRYVVNCLGRIGSQVIIPFRGDELAWRHLKVMGDLGQIVPIAYSPRSLESIERAVKHSNVVINLIGSQRTTRNFSLDDANRKIARLIARVSKEHHIPCYVHVSDLRADLSSPSEYARLKAQAEQEVRDINPDTIIVRPAPLFGAEDKLTNPYGVLLRYWTNMVPMVCGKGWHMNPVAAGDVARVIVEAVRGGHAIGKALEVVGPVRFNHEELCALVAQLCEFEGRYNTIPVPAAVMSRVLRVTDRLPRFRPMWSAEEIVMRQGRDACAVQGQKGVEVHTGKQNIESNALLWLRRFREPRSMNQVIGKGGDLVHPYLEHDHDHHEYHGHQHGPHHTHGPTGARK